MSTLKIGDRIPDFKLLNQEGQLIEIVKYIGKPMVIYFYPKDDTPGCTREACSFRDEFHRFSDLGVLVIGISSDNVESHEKFKIKYRLPFDLLADEGNTVRKQFGVPTNLFGMVPCRVTYIVDNQGIIRHIFNNQLNATKHVEESLTIIESF